MRQSTQCTVERMKTDNAQDVGKHAFEVAGLGFAPFRFVGASENVITYPDGTQQAGGTCDYCGTGIRTECHCVSRDGQRFKVGCNCISKVGDVGLLKAYKQSPEYRAHQRTLAAKRAAVVTAALQKLIDENATALAARPHPYGYNDRKTGAALTALDYWRWQFDHCGASGRASCLKTLQRILTPAEAVA